MSNLKITKLGIIKGGNCEKWFKSRSLRERGVRMAIDYLLNHNCIEIIKGMCKIVRIPKQFSIMNWVIKHCSSCDIEIGWRRFVTEIARPLFETQEKFRLSTLKRWGADKASLEFALTSTFKHHKMCYSKPHRDEIYKKWKPQENK